MISRRWSLSQSLLFGALGWLAAGTFVPASAQSPSPAGPDPLASNAELDALLAAHNWGELGAALAKPVPQRSMNRKLNWLRARIEAGGSFFLGFDYSGELFTIGSQLNVPDPNEDLRVTAGMIVLYTYSVIIIDGTRCKDKTAPSARVTQLFSKRAATLNYLRALPAEEKNAVVAVAAALEGKTAPLRGDDDLLCRGGMSEYQAGLQRGTQTEVPSPPGQVGRTVDVRPPADWKPELVAPDVYKPEQAQLRSGIKENLLRLVR